jgi:hypothetical protein
MKLKRILRSCSFSLLKARLVTAMVLVLFCSGSLWIASGDISCFQGRYVTWSVSKATMSANCAQFALQRFSCTLVKQSAHHIYDRKIGLDCPCNMKGATKTKHWQMKFVFSRRFLVSGWRSCTQQSSCYFVQPHFLIIKTRIPSNKVGSSGPMITSCINNLLS